MKIPKYHGISSSQPARGREAGGRKEVRKGGREGVSPMGYKRREAQLGERLKKNMKVVEEMGSDAMGVNHTWQAGRGVSFYASEFPNHYSLMQLLATLALGGQPSLGSEQCTVRRESDKKEEKKLQVVETISSFIPFMLSLCQPPIIYVEKKDTHTPSFFGRPFSWGRGYGGPLCLPGRPKVPGPWVSTKSICVMQQRESV